MTPDELGQLLDELGRRLGPGGEYVFRLAVDRAVIYGIVNAALGLVLLIGVAVAGWKLVRYVTAPDQDSYSDRPLGGMVAGIALGFAAFAGVLCLHSGTLTLLTPEYTALRDILSAIGAAR